MASRLFPGAFPVPADEADRLADLHRLDLLDTRPEERFERITRTARRLLGVQVAAVSLLDAERQWFKSCQGLPFKETPREAAFCAHAIMGPEQLVVEDARRDPRFADNPVVTGEMGIRFYAGRPLRGREGHLVGVLCVMDPVPRCFSQEDRRSLDDLAHWAEEELHYGRERYRTLFQQAPVALWEEDFSPVASWLEGLRAGGVRDLRAWLEEDPERIAEGVARIGVWDVNPAGVELIGARDKEEVLGGVPRAAVSPEGRGAFVEQFLAVWERRHRLTLETAGRKLCGERIDCIVDWSVPLVEGMPDYRRVLVAITDITERKRAEERLQRLVRSKDELIASVSHELRTPLTAVVGFAQLLSERGDALDEPERQEMVEAIAAEALDVSDIIEDLLVAARAEIGRLTITPTAVELGAQLAHVLEHRSGTRPVRPPVSGLPAVVWADPVRVRQILRNLAGNAARYGGERVWVEVEARPGAVALRVCDDGPGVPDADRERIFEPYHRAHAAAGQPGSVGLGLTVSRGLARLMEGDLTYRREDGVSVFELVLPVPSRRRPER